MMFIEKHQLPISVKKMQVIMIDAWLGDGTPQDPVRQVECCYSLDGELLAVEDETGMLMGIGRDQPFTEDFSS